MPGIEKSKMDRTNQNVLVLGATGSIGSAVAQVLQERGHRVTGLARSKTSELAIQQLGYDVLRGDITTPDKWIDGVGEFDAVVHAAITWSDDMSAVDKVLTNQLIRVLATSNRTKTLIYTGGCWIYGDTGDEVASEDTAYDQSSLWADAIEVAKSVCSNPEICGMVVHPAMVFERDGGVLDLMISSAKERECVAVVGSEKTRWTMVHPRDLAELYVLMLEKADAGACYNGSGTPGIEVGEIAQVLARRFGIVKPTKILPVNDELRAIASWYEGYAIDQQMSSEKAMRELGWNPKYQDVLAEIS